MPEKVFKFKIYTLSDPKTGLIRYVGRTIDSLPARLTKHIYDRKRSKNHRCHWINKLHRAGLKPVIELIDEPENERLFFELETYWIHQLRAWGFDLINQTDGGGGSLGFKHSEAAKKKVSEYWKARAKPPVKTMSKREQAEHLSKRLSIPIIQYDITGNEVRRWDSTKQAADYYGVKSFAICNVLKNPRLKSCGSFWKYVDEARINFKKRYSPKRFVKVD